VVRGRRGCKNEAQSEPRVILDAAADQQHERTTVSNTSAKARVNLKTLSVLAGWMLLSTKAVAASLEHECQLFRS
jgi:hypothetical protein